MPHFTKAEKEAKLTLTEANRQKAVALARKHQLVTARLEGELISRESAIRIWSQMLLKLRERVLVIPERVAPRVTVMSDEPAIRALLKRELEDALTTLSESAL